MERTVASLAAELHGRLIGDGTLQIHGVSNPELAQEGELAFVEDAQHMPLALQTHASALLIPLAVTDVHGRSAIQVEHPKLAFTQLLNIFHPVAAAQDRIHPSVVMGAAAQIGSHVDIRAHAVIGDRVRIGDNTIIEPGACIGDDVVIGEHCLIGPNVVLYHHTLLGDRVAIHGGSVIGGDGFGYVWHQGGYVKVPQVGNVVIEDDVELGCNVCVDRATVGSTIIQRGTKIDNLVQIAHNDRIGRHVVMAGQVGLSGSVTVGDYARFGGKAGVADHVNVGAQAEVGAGSVVIRSVAPKEHVWGYPARTGRTAMQQMTAIVHLPELLRTVRGLLARVKRTEQRLNERGRQQLDDRGGRCEQTVASAQKKTKKKS